MTDSPEAWRHAIVALANHRQFHAGEVLRNPWVLSRMLLWRRSGSLELRVNDREQALRDDEMLLLPWGHSVRYAASTRDPVLLTGIHLIPWQDPLVPARVGVAHSASATQADSSHRADRELPGLTGLCRIAAPPRSALRLLADGIVASWQDAPPPDWQRRLHAQTLFAAIYDAITQPHAAPDLPPELIRLRQFVVDNLHRPLGLAELAAFLGCSASTVGRLVRHACDTTPTDWLRSIRIERARRLLATTTLSIAEVAAAVGIPDVPYFSKVFKHYSGTTAAAYRRQSRVI